MSTVLQATQQELNRAADLLNLDTSGATGIACYTDTGEIAAIVVFTPPNEGNTTIHIQAYKKLWARKNFLMAVADYAFNILGVNRVTAFAPCDTPEAVNIAGRVGFKLEGHMRGFSFGDVKIFGMLKEDFK